MSRFRHCALLSALILAGCGDLPLVSSAPERVPEKLVLDRFPSVLTTGQTVPFTWRVLDADGQPIEPVPEWATPRWTSSNDVARLVPGGLELSGSGVSVVTLTLGDLRESTVLRVNPLSTRVRLETYVVQAVQRKDGSIPLIADRDGWLRVFAVADRANFFAPTARAKLYLNGAQVATLTLRALQEGISTAVEEGSLDRSWNGRIPAELMKPGLSVLVELDTDGGLRADPASTLRWPADGVPRPLDIRTVPPFRITFVPVHSTTGGNGNVTMANVEEYLGPSREIWPLSAVDVAVREPYVTTSAATTDDGWSAIITEVRQLRIADGSSRYYHGIVRRGGSWGGLGYVGFPVAISSDINTSSSADWTVAHELGHNFGRRHAPCGDPGGPDANYPHANGAIGVWGLGTSGRPLISPTTPDVMGYCRPRWVSDYTYEAALLFRSREASSLMSVRAAPEPVLVVAGRVRAGRAILEPAYSITAPAALPERAGPYTLEGFDAGGARVFSVSFAGDVVADLPGDERHFAYAVPVAPADAERIVRIAVRGPGVVAERVSPLVAASRAAAAEAVDAVADGNDVAFEWDANRYPLAVIRGADGTVLSMARGGTAKVRTGRRTFDVVLSEGTRSHTVRVEAR